MDPISLISILLFGIFAGCLGAMLGLGGGVLMIIFFIFALNLPAHQAVALSLLAVIATSSMGGSVYLKDKLTNIKLAMVLETCTVTGAVTGAILALILPSLFTEIVLGIVILFAALIMLKSPRSEKIVPPEEGVKLVLGRFYDPLGKCDVLYAPVRMQLGLLSSLLAGSISGIAGIGGGVVMVPIMNLMMKVPIKAAAGTSNFMVGVTAAASAFIYISGSFVDPYAAVPTVLGVMLGAYAGTHIMARVESITIKRLLGIVLIFFGAILFLKAGGLVSW
jgi:uncharacterized membrane protein YfcA